MTLSTLNSTNAIRGGESAAVEMAIGTCRSVVVIRGGCLRIVPEIRRLGMAHFADIGEGTIGGVTHEPPGSRRAAPGSKHDILLTTGGRGHFHFDERQIRRVVCRVAVLAVLGP